MRLIETLALGPEQELEMVGHQTIAVEAEWVAELGLAQGVEEGAVVVLVAEDGLAVVAAIQGVEDHAVVGRSWWSSPVGRLTEQARRVKKMN